jgi:enoyl-CoA hydratase
LSYETLQVERRGAVGWLVFDRPDRGNAMDASMLAELERAWHELDADPAVRVIVNTGNGRTFQTGLDVGQLSRDPEAQSERSGGRTERAGPERPAAERQEREMWREQSRRTKRAELKLTAWHNGVGKPVVAAVNGTCAGGGLHFVADADIVVVASDATFLDPHVSIGQVTAYEAIALVRTSPMEPIVRMALTGRHERITARRAYELGICSQVVDPPERLREAAQELAEKIARNPPAVLAATKRALWGALETGLTDARRAGYPLQLDGAV